MQVCWDWGKGRGRERVEIVDGFQGKRKSITTNQEEMGYNFQKLLKLLLLLLLFWLLALNTTTIRYLSLVADIIIMPR